MLDAHGHAACEAHARLAPFTFKRRDPKPQDVVIQITHCGICHSDIHYVNNDWRMTRYPVVPGHEIVGRVTQAGSQVQEVQGGRSSGHRLSGGLLPSMPRLSGGR